MDRSTAVDGPTGHVRGGAVRLSPLGRVGAAVLANRKAAAGALLLALFTAVALLAPLIAPYDPEASDFLPTAPPSAAHWLGTTSLGQDVLSQVIWGARPSLVIGLIAGIVATVISILVGVTAAYRGGLPDLLLSLATDVFLVLPALPLMIVIAAYLKGSGTWVLIAVIVVTGWAFGARQLRAQALSLRGREFLEAARVRGERGSYVIVCEMLPTMTSLIAANVLGAALYAVLAAAGLQFLGLGDINAISWGSMLYWAQNNEALQTGAPLWAIVPGLCIALLGAALALLNYAFDELSNPALRAARRARGRRAP
ncbi:MAG TPA: ABC transporter permease [Chloroflexota bacterium]|nr:ABC transporter permease [Chloroflexota bacterium]